MPRDHIGRCKVQIFASRHPQGQNIQRFDANCQLVWKFRSLKIWWPHMLHKIEAMVPLGRQGASLWNSGFFLQNLTKTQDITNSQHSPCLKPRFGMYPIIWIRGVNQRALQLEVLGERSTTNNSTTYIQCRQIIGMLRVLNNLLNVAIQNDPWSILIL